MGQCINRSVTVHSTNTEVYQFMHSTIDRARIHGSSTSTNVKQHGLAQEQPAFCTYNADCGLEPLESLHDYQKLHLIFLRSISTDVAEMLDSKPTIVKPTPEQIEYQRQHIDDNRVDTLIAANVICFSLGFIAVCMRLASRRMANIEFKADDWFILCALVRSPISL